MYDEREDFLRHEKEVTDFLELFKYAGIELNETMKLLDVGGGQGMHAGFLAKKFKQIYCIDLIEYNTIYNGLFNKLLSEKYERNQLDVPMSRICFIENSATDLIFKDNMFDLVISINSLEHIDDPLSAVQEMVRVTKPGGYLYLTFDPLWTADTGSHFSHRVSEPWAHLLLSENEFVEKMRRNQATEEEVSDFRNGMNRLRPSHYRTVFNKLIECHGLTVVDHAKWSGVVKEEYRHHPNYKLLLTRGYSEEELLLRGIRYVLANPAKKESSRPSFLHPLIRKLQQHIIRPTE